jgi:hypothetical protein
MNENAVLKSLMLLKAAYPRQPLPDETIDVYELSLGDLDPQLLKASVMRLITNSVFFPTVAEIRKTCADLVLEQRGLPTPMRAWSMIHGSAADCPEIVREAVRMSCGDFYNLHRSTNQAADRARFLEAYAELLKKVKEKVTELPLVKKYKALPAGDEYLEDEWQDDWLADIQIFHEPGDG